MRVTFLGTGSAMPTPDRVQTGLLLAEGDHRLLLDCGSGILHRLAGTGTGYEGIDALLLSHHHLDHVADCLPLLKARWLAGSPSLEIAGPPGTADLVDGLLGVHGYLKDRFDLTIRDVEGGPVSIAGFEARTLETRHSMAGYAYRFDGADGSFTFSGDSEAFDDLAAFADGSTVFAVDCSFPDDVDVSNHPTPSELGETLAGYEYGRVVLTHLYPHTDGAHSEMLASIGQRYDGKVSFAHDGLTVEI